MCGLYCNHRGRSLLVEEQSSFAKELELTDCSDHTTVLHDLNFTSLNDVELITRISFSYDILSWLELLRS